MSLGTSVTRKGGKGANQKERRTEWILHGPEERPSAAKQVACRILPSLEKVNKGGAQG